MNKPVVGGPTPAVQEVIGDGHDGFVVPQAPEAIAEKICLLLLDPDLRKQMAQRGRRKVEEHFTWEKIADRVGRLYQRLLD
jgi:glycosyltransferase involved in cell wall biosynthesis